MGSIGKKIKNIIGSGLDPVKEGKKNFKANIPEVEALAKKRAAWSKKFLVEEPIDFLRVEDQRIPELSNKMHDSCGCTAAYLFRQSIKKRPEWEE